MCTHNISFCGEIRKNINTFGLKKLLIKCCVIIDFISKITFYPFPDYGSWLDAK